MNDDRLVTYDTAVAELPELPEVWRRSVYQSAAQVGLTETDPLWWFLVAQAKQLHSFLAELPASKVTGTNGNGISPAQLKPAQIEALTVSLKALPGRDDVASKKDLQRLEQAIQKIEKARERQSAGQAKTEHWASRWAKLVGVGLILIGIGYLLCWARTHSELEAQMIRDHQLADERVMHVINTRPEDYRPFLDFISYGGTMTRESIPAAPGTIETEGFVMLPGRLAKPWISTLVKDPMQDCVVFPIPLKR